MTDDRANKAAATAPFRGKIFGVGLNKTGTSSLKVALEALGYKVAGPNKALHRALAAGDREMLRAVVDAHDAFEDMPYPLFFETLHDLYGTDAKFILTVRKSPEVWFRSIQNHARNQEPFSRGAQVYGFYRPFGRQAQYTASYEGHNAKVRAYFAAAARQDRFLELCFDTGDGWAELCPFLGHAVPDTPFPHANKTGKRRILRRLANGVIEPAYRLYAWAT